MAPAMGLLLAILYAGTRFIPMVMLVPLFGGRHVAAPLRVGLACALGLLEKGGLSVAQCWSLSAISAELTTGLLLAIPPMFIVRGLETAGHCFDQACGTNSVEILFPTGEDRTSPVAHLFSMVVILASFAYGVQLQLITLVMASYGTVPLGDWTALRSGVLEILLSSFSGAVKAGVVIGLPFLSLAMGIELVIACAARLTPGISLSPHSMQIKNLAALGLVILGWDRISAGFLDWTRLLPAFVEAVIGALGK